MARHLKRATCEYTINNVLTRYGVNPRVCPIPIEVLTPLARDVRQELDRVGAGIDDLNTCFDLLVAEVLDTAMTDSGQQMVIDCLATGFRAKTSLTS